MGRPVKLSWYKPLKDEDRGGCQKSIITLFAKIRIEVTENSWTGKYHLLEIKKITRIDRRATQDETLIQSKGAIISSFEKLCTIVNWAGWQDGKLS